jgi:hypothetical protein
MSLYIDVKFLGQIGNRLPLFKRKGEYLYNCRCIICGDSQKNKSKARGYFYRQSNDLFYKCHNCEVSQHFGTYLKNFDPLLYREYALERYTDGGHNIHAKVPTEITTQFKEPVFAPRPERNVLDELLVRVSDCDINSEVREFCTKRLIPDSQLSRLYFIDNIKRIEQLNIDRYKNTVQGSEPRLVIPFYNSQGQLIGVSCRGLRDETLRYITVKIKEEDMLVFGIESLKHDIPMYAVEGPIDSLFLPNCIAVGGTGFNKIDLLNLKKDNLTLIVDNQPRNSEVVKIYNKLIKQGYKMLFWPEYTSAKDINDLVLQGVSGDGLKAFIDSNSYRNLTAQVKFNEWKKV